MRRAKLLLLVAGTALLLLGCSSSETEPSTRPIFSDEPIWSSGTQTSGGDGIARLLDVDQDGDLDFVTSAPEPRRWVAYRNDGGMIAAEPFWQSHETTDCDHIDVLDFNHDGWMDLAGTHESYCSLYFNRSGEFNQAPDWETGLIANANQIDFGDFDQDGDLDMVMAAGEPIDGVALFVNDSGTPAQQVSQKLGHEEYSESAIFADYDGDGDLDITAAYRGGKIVLFQNSSGEFDGGTTIFEDLESPWTQRLYWRDLDGDGAVELFCAKGPWGANSGRACSWSCKRAAPRPKSAGKAAPTRRFTPLNSQMWTEMAILT